MAEKRISNKMHDEAFRVRNVIIEREMNELKHLTYDEVVAVLNIYNENKGVGTLTVNIDCSDALKGLKAVTREAKKTTTALKELEEQQEKMKSNLDIKIYKDQQCDPEELAKALHDLMNEQKTRGIAF